jgi:glycosyltransferase involved in cell wall biosynthesis
MVNASTKEAMPNAFIEAAAHGCAILSGLDPDGFATKFGYHAKPAHGNKYPDSDDFGRGLAWLLEENRWRQRGELARSHVRANFETEVAIRQHIQIYRNHLGESSATQPEGA